MGVEAEEEVGGSGGSFKNCFYRTVLCTDSAGKSQLVLNQKFIAD